MTDAQNQHTSEAKPGTPSLPLLADSAELLRVRILPAEFSRLLGVSKQTVSRWIREGKISINPIDGRLDVQTAVQQVLRNTDPGRLRARVLRQAVEDVQQLRSAVAMAENHAAAVEAELASARKRVDHLEHWQECGIRAEEIFRGLIIKAAGELRSAPTSAWPAILERLNDSATLEADPLPYEDESGAFTPIDQCHAPPGAKGGDG